jgi:hypothetical protein
MFGFGESQDAYEQVQQGHHASLSHEAIAAAASFEVNSVPPACRHMRSGFLSTINAFRVGHEGIREPPTQRG